MNWFSRTLLLAYLSASLAVAPFTRPLSAKESAKQDSTSHVLQLKDPSGNFYTWTQAFPDSVIDFGEIGIFPKLPASDAYPDNLATIVDQLAARDTAVVRWKTLPIPVSYGGNTSSGVSFDSLAREIGMDINAGTGLDIVAESGVAGYGILFQYADSSTIDIQKNPDGSPQLATVTIRKDLYDPEPAIAGLFAAALGFSWSLDPSSVSGNGAAFSSIDYQTLATWFSHPFGYDLGPSWSDSSRGDTEKPHMALSAPNEVTAGTAVTLDASASTDDSGIVRFLWDTDFTGFFDPDTVTATGTLETIFSRPEPSSRTVMVAGEDANRNRSYAAKDVTIIPSPTAPVLDGYQIDGSYQNILLRIVAYWDLLVSFSIVETDMPGLQIDPWTSTLFNSYALPDSMVGNAYYALIAADNGSETTTARIDWIINKYRHAITYDYTKDGVSQTVIQLKGTDRLTNFLRNKITTAGYYGYSQFNLQELEELAQRQVNRPDWVESDFLHYNFTTYTSWPSVSAKLDSILTNTAPYHLEVITITVSQN